MKTKMDILNRLVKEGAIDLEEALILMEADVKIIEKIVIKEIPISKEKTTPQIIPFSPYIPIKPEKPYPIIKPDQPYWKIDNSKIFI